MASLVLVLLECDGVPLMLLLLSVLREVRRYVIKVKILAERT